jgi:hypothetical protein
MLQVYCGQIDYCHVPFKASKILDSLQDSNVSCLYKGNLPVFKQRSKALKVIRWWLLPLLFLVGVWMLSVDPKSFQKHWIDPIMFDVDKMNKDNVVNILPILPEDMLDAYDMGKIVDRIEVA